LFGQKLDGYRGAVARNEIEIQAPPESVWAVLADASTYADWVVGAQEVRDADEAWPQPGAALHHRTGLGPLAVEDETRVEEAERPRRLVLRARIRPFGELRVALELRATPRGTTVVLEEEPVAGALDKLPGVDALIWERNALSLPRLKALAEA
jgi:uncharacterized protein YndB with AHSA1/START domain